jgi:hypothetical protein
MRILIKLLSSIVLLENKFKNNDDFGPSQPYIPSYNIVYEGRDSEGRPELMIESHNYRDVPSFGTWPGYEVHTKVARRLWHVHYENTQTV